MLCNVSMETLQKRMKKQKKHYTFNYNYSFLFSHIKFISLKLIKEFNSIKKKKSRLFILLNNIHSSSVIAIGTCCCRFDIFNL